MYTTLPITAVDVHFPLTCKKITGLIRGTVYTKFVYTFPYASIDVDFPLTGKILLVL